MFSLCKQTGGISSIPATPGLVVWNSGHIGISIDGVWAIEARGFNYGVVKTRIKDRSWTKWGQLPASMLDYVSGGAAPVEPEQPATPEKPDSNSNVKCPYPEPDQSLKKGSKGEGVKWLQWMLTKCGYSVGPCGIDGIFGSATRSAALRYQQKRMETNGTADALTCELLKRDAGDDDAEAD